jgi:hypothetical protein
MINYHHQRSPACLKTARRYRYAHHRTVDGKNRSGDGLIIRVGVIDFQRFIQVFRTGLIHHQLDRLPL